MTRPGKLLRLPAAEQRLLMTAALMQAAIRIGLAVLPLQLAAWLARGLVFQYLGLTASTAYVRLYRATGRPAPAHAARERAAPLEYPA